MKEVLKYETDDGVIHNTFLEAKEHERKLEFERYCVNTRDRLDTVDGKFVDVTDLSKWIYNHQFEILIFLGVNERG